MKVKENQWTEPVALEDYIAGQLNGSDYGSGQIETIDRSLDKTQRMLSRLIEVLAPQIPPSQLVYILDGYASTTEILP